LVVEKENSSHTSESKSYLQFTYQTLYIKNSPNTTPAASSQLQPASAKQSRIPEKLERELTYEELANKIKREFLDESAITVDVFLGAVEIEKDIEIDEDGKEMIASPITDALNQRYIRFGKEHSKNKMAAIFRDRKDDVWQLKQYLADNSQGKGYLAPRKIGDSTQSSY